MFYCVYGLLSEIKNYYYYYLVSSDIEFKLKFLYKNVY